MKRLAEEKFFSSLINPPNVVMNIMTICFLASAVTTLGATVVAPTNDEVMYRLACDLAAAPVQFMGTGQFSIEQWGICKNANISY